MNVKISSTITDTRICSHLFVYYQNVVTLLISALQVSSRGPASCQIVMSIRRDSSLVTPCPHPTIETTITISISHHLHRDGHLLDFQGTDLVRVVQAQVYRSPIVGQVSPPRLTSHSCLDQTGYLVPLYMINVC
jgi:hypothetical protein